MEDKDWKLVEYTVEAFLIFWLGYMFLYQNYLLHTWHRGLPLPSKWPFMLISFGMAALFLWYEWSKLEAAIEEAPAEPAAPETPHEEAELVETETVGEE